MRVRGRLVISFAMVLFMRGSSEAEAPPAKPDPVAERAQALKEAADLLEKAGAARVRGNRNFAEQLFSSAELIVGVDVLADLAPRFREGAPPRITTPLKTLPREAPQPAAVGSSDEEQHEEKPARGSLTGVVKIEGAGGGDGFGVVTLEPASGKWKRRAPRQRVVEQRDRQFAPRVLAVPVGSTVAFPNFDTVYHNVFSLSEAKPFDLGLYKNGQAREMTFDREGIIRVGCNLHANMWAHIVVVSAPHYAITDGKGRFAFRSLEPGRYKLRAWSERTLKPITQEITINPEQNSVTVKVPADAPAGGGPDKFGAPRGKGP
jgi:plastocyanin